MRAWSAPAAGGRARSRPGVTRALDPRPISSIATSPLPVPISSGLATLRSCQLRPGSCIWLSCWMPGAANRRLVDANHLRADLVVDALDMALGQRRPPDGVIVHSDQGSQYTSVAFGKRCKEAGVRPSMGSVGDAYDNAMCESFFATLECELLNRRRFASQAEARVACFSFIEGWNNPVRRHSALNYRSPIRYDQDMQPNCYLPSPETVHVNGETPTVERHTPQRLQLAERFWAPRMATRGGSAAVMDRPADRPA